MSETYIKASDNSSDDEILQSYFDAFNCRTLLLQYQAGVLTITLNRPEQRNALNQSMVNEIIAVVDACASKPAIRVLVLRGNGKHFCAGGDISDMHDNSDNPDAKRQAIWNHSHRFGELSLAIYRAPLVVVALVQGAVLGGGFGMACAADIVIADQQVIFSLPETGLGVVPAQIAPFVVARIGLSQARRLALLGERIEGEEARRLGLVHFLSRGEAEREAKLESLLAQLSSRAPNANKTTKEILQNFDSVIKQNDFHPVLDKAADYFTEAVLSDEGQEGAAAFMEKRKPAWVQEQGEK